MDDKGHYYEVGGNPGSDGERWWFMAHTRTCPHDCPVCDESIAGEEDGSTPETAVRLYCPKCGAAAGSRRTAGVYCYSCCCFFPYTYTIGFWYISESPLEIYTTRFIGAPNYWEFKTEVLVKK